MAQITSKIFINRFIAGTLLWGSSAIITTKIQATQPLPNQEQDISNDRRKNLLDLRALLFQKNIGNKEAMKTSCGQLIREKGIDLNTPICSMTLLEEAILCRLEDAAEILIELSSEIKIPLGRKKGIGKKDGPSLLHIATYSPKIMNEALELREKREMVQDTKIFELYEQTRTEHPGRSYASKRIVEALLKTDLKSQIDKPEMGEGTSPLNNVDRFLENIQYLKQHPAQDPENDAAREAEYREVRIALRPFPTKPPPLRRIPILPEDGRLYEIAKGKRR